MTIRALRKHRGAHVGMRVTFRALFRAHPELRFAWKARVGRR